MRRNLVLRGGWPASRLGMARRRGVERDQVLEAFDQLVKALTEGVEHMEGAIDLATEMRERRLEGAGFEEVESGIDDPGIHELITTTLLTVQSRSRRLRQAWARTLRSEGRTLQEIADLFGVSHQRVSALLNQDASAGDRRGRR